MIVKDEGSYFELIRQHEHARVSYEIVREWGDSKARASDCWEAVVTAVREHDRAWIPLDAYPLMDKKSGRPYSFTDYPEEKKIKAYQRGIQELAEIDIYSGLLSSRHYASFYKGANIEGGQDFLEEETRRQNRYRGKLEKNPDEDFHLKILQFCDDLSLYVCMNKPGARKEEELSWFKHGFRHTFSFIDEQTVIPYFRTKREVKLKPFPLKNEKEIYVNSTLVEKDAIKSNGLQDALNNGTEKETCFLFTR